MQNSNRTALFIGSKMITGSTWEKIYDQICTGNQGVDNPIADREVKIRRIFAEELPDTEFSRELVNTMYFQDYKSSGGWKSAEEFDAGSIWKLDSRDYYGKPELFAKHSASLAAFEAEGNK